MSFVAAMQIEKGVGLSVDSTLRSAVVADARLTDSCHRRLSNRIPLIRLVQPSPTSFAVLNPPPSRTAS